MAEDATEDLTAVEAEVLPQTAEEKVRCRDGWPKASRVTKCSCRSPRALHVKPALPCCRQRASVYCIIH